MNEFKPSNPREAAAFCSPLCLRAWYFFSYSAIEEILYQIPGVKEAAVIGKPDARRGEHPVAFVAAKDGPTPEEKAILTLLRQKLADYKVPKKVTFLPALPRNATGKVLKTELRLQA